MRKSIYTYAMMLALPFIALMTSCEPRALTAEDVIISEEDQLQEMLEAENPEGYKIYNINDLLDTYMTEKGNFMSDSSQYRTRSYYKGLYLFSIDTFPKAGPGIYIRARVATDDYGGNFYKSLVIQQMKDGQQQTLRISVDMGSASGLYQKGQEILIRCNGLSIGRYANQPQLCVPSYNNNVYAHSANAKIGWAPGRIPSPRVKEATKLIGQPDKSKVVYEEMTMNELNTKYTSKYKMDTWADVKAIRQFDGHLVRITKVNFTGSFDDQGTLTNCEYYVPATPSEPAKGDPEVDGSNAYVFAPSTGNVGYPQSRYVKGGSPAKLLLVAASEYAKYAHFYLPPKKYVGYVQGVLGYYLDQPPTTKYPLSDKKWSVTPSNLTEDILPDCQNATDADKRWKPQEWINGVPQDQSIYP